MYILSVGLLETQVRDVGHDADWRSNPLSHAQVVARLIGRHGVLNPLLEAPYVKTAIFKMDWLHAADQGVTADFIGNELHYFVSHMPGTTEKKRYEALWHEIQEYYVQEDVQDRPDCLKPTFIENRAGMKLRCSAAKCRKLVPFALRLAEELCDREDPVEEAIYKASYHLNEVYGALSSTCADADAVMREHSTKFALQYVALHDHLNGDDERVFRIKPKLHFFLHLCSDGGRPSKHWCYRDEDFGGSVARAARRRGGMRRPQATSNRVLTCLKIGTPRISIR